MSDFVILKAMEQRSRWRSLHQLIPMDTLVPDARALLGWFKVYYETYPDKEHLEHSLLLSLIKTKVSMPMEQWTPLKATVDRLAAFDDAEAVQGIVNNLLERDLAGRAGAIIDRYEEGQEIALVQQLKTLVQDTSRQVENSSAGTYIDEDIGDILADQGTDRGLKLPTRLLKDHVSGLLGGDTLMVAARVDKGKCLSPETPVLLASGEVVRADEVKVGDVLAGPFRNNTVLGTTRGRDTMYRVTYSDGTGYTVNSEHILSLKRSSTEGPHKTGDILNVPVKEYIKWPEGRKQRYKGWFAAANFTAQSTPLPMPPYLLGLWLGDGTATKPQYTTADTELLQKFVAHYGNYSAKYGDYTYAFYGTRMLQDLEAAGVRGNKHIPQEYLRASLEDRQLLLAGLLDSDGHIGDSVDIIFKCSHLAEQVIHLARSVGIYTNATPSKEWKRATNSDHAGDWYYRVRLGREAWELPLQRKVHLEAIQELSARPPKRKGLVRSIEVTEVGVGEYFGFGLDGDHLFLLGDFTVTHNTSFLAAICAEFAPQVKEYFGDRPILWLNNEGPGRRIYPRIYSAALAKTSTELVEMYQAGTLVEEYNKAVHGCSIRVKDIHGASLAQIEQTIEAMQPCVVIVDMMANVRSAAVQGGNKTDALEATWQGFRELAVMYDFIGIGTAQISTEGDDTLYPGYGAIKDSKTAAQGAVDVMLMLGALNDPQYQTIRGLSTPKNKSARPGFPSHAQGEVHFDAQRCQFTDGE